MSTSDALSRLSLSDGFGLTNDSDDLFRPPLSIYPERSTFAKCLEASTRKLSLAHTHETNLSLSDRRYEIAYPLYLSAASGFIWAHKNIQSAALGDNDHQRVTKLRENLMRQTKKALQRAEQIKDAKGAEWAKRWSGKQSRVDVEAQAKVLHSSSEINGLKFEPWLPYSDEASSSKSTLDPHPLPRLSQKQSKIGACFRMPGETFDQHSGQIKIWPCGSSEEAPRGEDITQDAVTNCGLVAAMEVIAEHDRRWNTKMLRRPLVKSPDLYDRGAYELRIHFNGCPRRVIIDNQLPFISPEKADKELQGEPDLPLQLMSASVQTSNPRDLILLPSLVEKAYLTILTTYAPPGSVPAEDLHALTGWIPEVIHMNSRSQADQSPMFQREMTWQRIKLGWSTGSLLICAGSSATSSPHLEEEDVERVASNGSSDLVPSHSYAVLDCREEGGVRQLTLMNPWRPKTSIAGNTSKPFVMEWSQFCQSFSTLHLAWDPRALFTSRAEVHASWKKDQAGLQDGLSSIDDAKRSSAVLHNVNFSLKVTWDDKGFKMSARRDHRLEDVPGDGEIWLHLSRHLSATKQVADDRDQQEHFIAIHIFESSATAQNQKEVRVMPLAGGRESSNGGIYVDSVHHLVRFRPNFFSSSILRSQEPGLKSSKSDPLIKEYNIVVSLHCPAAETKETNFTLRAWSSYALSLNDAAEDVDADQSWTSSLHSSWNQLTSGGHRFHSTFHQNPQYTLAVPSDTPETTLTFTLMVTPPSLAAHLYLLHSPLQQNVSAATRHIRRIDSIEPSAVVAESGPYSYGLVKMKVDLPSTPPDGDQLTIYHLVVSTYHPGSAGHFKLQISSPQSKVKIFQQPSSNLSYTPQHKDSLILQPSSMEGAGMFHKQFEARWDQNDGTAAGAPRFGKYNANPTWIIRFRQDDHPQTSQLTAVRCVFRLVSTAKCSADEHAAHADPSSSPINLSIFDNAPSNGQEIATTGPYTSSPCGVAIHDIRLKYGKEYRIVASSFHQGYEGTFKLLLWSETISWSVLRVV
ncbi:unnamed protein product [Sympodiomycopsis kandeliae]